MHAEKSFISHLVGTLPQLVAVLFGTLSAVSDGMQYGWSAPVIPILLSDRSPFQTTEDECEWLETLYWIGSVCGLPATMLLVDRIGRKKSILVATFITLLAWIVTALAASIEYLFVARFLAGVSSDMNFIATPMYIAEIADQKIRGFLASMIYLMMLIGVLTVYSVAPFVPYFVPAVIGAVLSVTQLIVFPFMPESPYYLLFVNKTEKARKALIRLRSPHEADEQLGLISKSIEKERQMKGKPQDLIFVKSNRKGVIIMAVLNAAQHLSGVTVIIMNVHPILEAAKSVYMDPSYVSIIFSAILLVAATLASIYMDKYGRRVLLITSSILTGLSLMVLAVYFHIQHLGYNEEGISWLPIAAVMFYAAAFKSGLGIVPIVITAEIFPASIKAIGMSVSDVMYMAFALLSLQIYYVLNRNFGMYASFYTFGTACFLTTIFTYFVIPETKGKTLEEIQLMLKGDKEESKSNHANSCA